MVFYRKGCFFYGILTISRLIERIAAWNYVKLEYLWVQQIHTISAQKLNNTSTCDAALGGSKALPVKGLLSRAWPKVRDMSHNIEWWESSFTKSKLEVMLKYFLVTTSNLYIHSQNVSSIFLTRTSIWHQDAAGRSLSPFNVISMNCCFWLTVRIPFTMSIVSSLLVNWYRGVTAPLQITQWKDLRPKAPERVGQTQSEEYRVNEPDGYGFLNPNTYKWTGLLATLQGGAQRTENGFSRYTFSTYKDIFECVGRPSLAYRDFFGLTAWSVRCRKVAEWVVTVHVS